MATVTTGETEKTMKTTKKEGEVKKAVPVPLPLPYDVCLEIANYVNENEALAFVMTCKGFRDAMKESLKARKTMKAETTAGHWLSSSLKHWEYIDSNVPVSEDWIKWAFSVKCTKKSTPPRYVGCDVNIEDFHRRVLVFLAARGGFKDVLLWLKPYVSRYCLLRSETSIGAARGGHINVLKYLKSEGMPFHCLGLCSYDAAEGGHIEVLEYLKSEGVPFDKETCYYAARGGHIDVLKYFKSEGVEFDKWTCYAATAAGHIGVLKYLKSEGVSFFDSESCEEAAQEGYLEVLKYWRSEGVIFNEDTYASAALGGQIKVLEYFKSEGVPFDEEACYWAAYGGHLVTLMLLRREGCPWYAQDCIDATRDEEIKEWIQSNM